MDNYPITVWDYSLILFAWFYGLLVSLIVGQIQHKLLITMTTIIQYVLDRMKTFDNFLAKKYPYLMSNTRYKTLLHDFLEQNWQKRKNISNQNIV